MGIFWVMAIALLAGMLMGPCVPAPNSFLVGLLIYIAYIAGRKEERISAKTCR